MGAVTLNWPRYPEPGLVTLNLVSEIFTKCCLGQHAPSKQHRKLITARDQGRSGNHKNGYDQDIFKVLPTYHPNRIRRSKPFWVTLKSLYREIKKSSHQGVI